jgi:hypothetical protein
MAPGLVEPASDSGSNLPVNKQLFPDGFKTSGQHEPIYSKIQPYEVFPKEIVGPTVWKKDDYQNKPEKWQHSFTESEISELGAAADAFLESQKPLTAITKVSCPNHAIDSYTLLTFLDQGLVPTSHCWTFTSKAP